MWGSQTSTRESYIFSYNINTATFDTLVSLDNTFGQPQGNLIVDTLSHIIYAATVYGGDSSKGALYSYNMNTKTVTTLITFYGPNGSLPTCLLMYDTSSKCIYSTTYEGGTNNYGVLYRYNTVTHHDSILFNFQDSAAFGHRPMHGPNHPSVGVQPCGLMLPNNAARPNKVNNVVAKKETISVYPNPTSTNTKVVFSAMGKHYLEMDDVTGRKLRSAECTGKQYQLNCEGLAPGVYFIITHDGGQKFIATAKIIIE